MPWDNPSGYENTVSSLAQMCLEKQERRKKTENVYLERKLLRHLPGGPGLKDPPSYAGDMGSTSGQGTKMPHAAGQLTAPRLLSLLTPELEGHNSRKALPSQGETPFTPTKIPSATTKTRGSQMNKCCYCLVTRSCPTLGPHGL